MLTLNVAPLVGHVNDSIDTATSDSAVYYWLTGTCLAYHADERLFGQRERADPLQHDGLDPPMYVHRVRKKRCHTILASKFAKY